jgi:hypothetical protein
MKSVGMRLLWAVTFVVVASGIGFAQGDRGTITGTVTDAANAVVGGASIELKNTQSGATFTAATTETGNYTLAQLPPGTYQLTVSLAGFKKYIRQNIVLEPTQTLRLDAGLEVGAPQDSITINEEVPLLSTENGEITHEIPASRLVDLGLLGTGGTFSSSQGLRFYQTEIQLIPGASVPASGFILGVRVNGAVNGTQRTQIDGMDSTNGINSVQAGTGISVDAMQETAIQTSTFAPEFGSVGGGLFNITTRSGTNRFHGAGYDYHSNEAFDAYTPFSGILSTPPTPNTRPRIRRNDYGFSMGGPIWLGKLYDGHDKSFLFFNFEQYREFFVLPSSPITVPTDAYRLGDFSKALTGRVLGTDPLGRPIMEGAIYDPSPATTHIVNGQVVRDPFPGNIIKPDRFDPVALAIQKLIPEPTSPNLLFNNYLPLVPNDRVTENWSLKPDHQINSKAKISGLFLTNYSYSQYSQSLNGSEGLPAMITATRGTFSHSYNWRVNFDYTISPTRLLHLGAGLLLYQLNDHSPTQNFSDSSIGLTGVPNPGGRFPTIGSMVSSTGAGGMVGMGPGVGGAQSLTKQMTPSFQASLTDVRGNHTLKFGSEVRIFGYPYLSLAQTNGSFSFSGAETAQPYAQSTTIGVGTVGFPYASFLLGLVDSGTVNPPANVRTGKRFISLFAQDSWKVTRKLTLDYGLRYDFDTYPREQYGRMPSLAPTTPNPTAGGYPGATIYEQTCHCSFARNYPYAFGPRFGMAYQFLPKSVLRLGAGIVYDGTATASTGATSSGPNDAFSSPTFGTQAMTLGGGVPQSYVLPWPNFSPGAFPNPNFPAAANGPANVVDRNAGRPARQIQWNIGIQREVIKDLVIDASYVGNRGAWWLSSSLVNYNALTPQMLLAKGLDITNPADRAILTAQIGSSAAGRFQNQIPYQGFGTTNTVAQAVRPFPQFKSGLAAVWAPLGRTWYDALQFKATKRVSHGLDVVYVFSYQHEYQLGVEGGVINGIQNRSVNKTISGFSQPLVSTLSVNYRVPAFAERNKIVSQVLRDWAVGGTFKYASGTPILAPASINNLSSLLFQSTFFNRVPGQPLFLKDLNCHCIDPTHDLVLNPNAWSDPGAGNFGTGAMYYNDYRYARRPNEVMTLGRVFKFNEQGMQLTLRMNFQNIFNRTYLPNPGGGPTTPTAHGGNGLLSNGFGFINYGTIASSAYPPRQGTLEMRFQF